MQRLSTGCVSLHDYSEAWERIKSWGAGHTSAEGASSVEGSGGILPREILKTITPETPFPAIWALNLEFILIAKMS